MTKNLDVCVIGAGIAGSTFVQQYLASLRPEERDNASILAVDGASQPGGRLLNSRYDFLNLHTPNNANKLPGLSYEQAGLTVSDRGYMSVAQYGQYFQAFLDNTEFNLRQHIQCSQRITKVTYHPNESYCWKIYIEGDKEPSYVSKHLVDASGMNAIPIMPQIDSLDDFTRNSRWAKHTQVLPVINTQDIQGKEFIIVGAGNSAWDYAQELLAKGANRVHLVARCGIHMIPQDVLGGHLPVTEVSRPASWLSLPSAMLNVVSAPLIANLRARKIAHGIPDPEKGLFNQIWEDKRVPPILSEESATRIFNAMDDGRLVFHIGELKIAPNGVVRVVDSDANYSELNGVDGMIFATGFKRNSSYYTDKLQSLQSVVEENSDGMRCNGDLTILGNLVSPTGMIRDITDAATCLAKEVHTQLTRRISSTEVVNARLRTLGVDDTEAPTTGSTASESFSSLVTQCCSPPRAPLALEEPCVTFDGVGSGLHYA